jgi:hypothetical protein
MAGWVKLAPPTHTTATPTKGGGAASAGGVAFVFVFGKQLGKVYSIFRISKTARTRGVPQVLPMLGPDKANTLNNIPLLYRCCLIKNGLFEKLK